MQEGVGHGPVEPGPSRTRGAEVEGEPPRVVARPAGVPASRSPPGGRGRWRRACSRAGPGLDLGDVGRRRRDRGSPRSPVRGGGADAARPRPPRGPGRAPPRRRPPRRRARGTAGAGEPERPRGARRRAAGGAVAGEPSAVGPSRHRRRARRLPRAGWRRRASNRLGRAGPRGPSGELQRLPRGRTRPPRTGRGRSGRGRRRGGPGRCRDRARPARATGWPSPSCAGIAAWPGSSSPRPARRGPSAAPGRRAGAGRAVLVGGRRGRPSPCPPCGAFPARPRARAEPAADEEGDGGEPGPVAGARIGPRPTYSR